MAGELKVALAPYGIDAFVAHDDIEPTHQWEDEIVAALRTCGAFILLLTEGVHESNWVDQDSGWAVSSGVLVIPVAVDLTPYGFIGRWQAVNGQDRTAEELADATFDVVLGDARTAPTTIDAIVTKFEQAESFVDARWKFERLERVPAITEGQLERIENAYRHNHELRGAFYVQNRISEFLRGHWEVHGIIDYHMADL